MYINKKWTIIVFSMVITAILTSLLASIGAFIYTLYIQVFEFKDQIYLSVRSKSFLNKQMSDYINDPLLYSLNLDSYWDKSNFNFINNSRYVDSYSDVVIPGSNSIYLMTSFDNESPYLLNKIKSIVVYFNKENESWDLKIGLLKYNEDFSLDLQTWNILVKYSDSDYCSDTPTYWDKSEYKCRYYINDFDDFLNNNVYDYLLFFSSDKLISYSLSWLDINWDKVNIPSRYLHMVFQTYSLNNSIFNNIDKKLDLYSKYKLNINNYLYNLGL